ncbi:acyl-CoA dehydrogenase family protein [Thermodesulfobacteriota bacterium]
MDFDFTDEQNMLRDTIEKFLQKECPREYCRQVDDEERFPFEVFSKMAELGWLALPFPEEYGGHGGNVIDELLITEELSRPSAAMGLAYFMSVCFGGKSIEYFGSEEQKHFYLPKLFSGEALYALALTEPGGGTDVLGALKTKAEKKGDHFLVNGQKVFTTSAHISKYLITLARSDMNAKSKADGCSVLIIENDAPGVEIRRLKKLGIKATGTNEIFFENVKVPLENLLGTENKGWYHLTHTLNNERVSSAGVSLGIARAAFDDALQYSKERTAFGKPIGAMQVIQHYLAETATEIEMARLLAYKAAWLQSRGEKNERESTMAKLAASEAGFKAATRGMRILGGYGYMMEYDMQRYFRDSELFLFGPISNEMAKNFIAMGYGLPRSF